MAILFALISHLASYEPIISAGSWSGKRKKKEEKKEKKKGKKGRKKGFYFGRRADVLIPLTLGLSLSVRGALSPGL